MVNHVEVEFLPVYHPSPEEAADPVLYASNVRNLMAVRLGVPLVEQSTPEERQLMMGGVRPDWAGRRVLVGRDVRAVEEPRKRDYVGNGEGSESD